MGSLFRPKMPPLPPVQPLPEPPSAELSQEEKDRIAAEQREIERKIAEAKTEEERTMAVQQADFYRLNLVFSGDEAELVKNKLGDTPAATLLEMCKS